MDKEDMMDSLIYGRLNGAGTLIIMPVILAFCFSCIVGSVYLVPLFIVSAVVLAILLFLAVAVLIYTTFSDV